MWSADAAHRPSLADDEPPGKPLLDPLHPAFEALARPLTTSVSEPSAARQRRLLFFRQRRTPEEL